MRGFFFIIFGICLNHIKVFYKLNNTDLYNIELLTSLTNSTNSLIGLVGMYQTDNPEYQTIIPSLLESRSGKYLQRHPLLNNSNIDQCASNYDHYTYPAYSALTEYSQGDKVAQGGTDYEYTNPVPSTGNTPPNTTYWKVIDPYSDYLLRNQQQAIEEVLDDCFNEKMVKGLTKTVFDEITLFTGTGNVNEKVINSGKAVGLRVTVSDGRGLLALIKRIGTQFSEAVSFTMYIYHSSQVAAIATVSIVHGTANNFQWTSTENELRFFSDDYDAGGEFFITYFQDDLGSAQAIKKEYDWSRRPCSSGCNETNLYLYDTWSKFITVTPFEVTANHLNGTNLFDIDHAGWNYGNNYGLNLNLSVRCDLTEYIKQEGKQLANAIAISWRIIQLNDIAYNVRSNKISAKTKQLALMEMDKDKTNSLVNKYKEAIKALSFNFSSLDNNCLTCNEEYGIQWSGM